MKFTILGIEYSMCPPDERLGDALFNDLFGRATPHVPVLHIFGRTAASPPHASVCCHVHDHYPYFCVPCPGDLAGPLMTPLHFGTLLEAVAISKLRLAPGSRLLHHVALVQGTPFYGYHATQRCFFKIFVYQPSMIQKLASLLQTTSSVGGRVWQPYEAHVPYHFQFMVDYGLVGTGVMEITSGGTLRLASHVGVGDDETTTVAPQELSFSEDVRDGCTPAPIEWDLPRLSSAEIELDITPQALPPCTTPGSSLNGVKRALREYIRDRGHNANILWDAVKPVAGRHGTVSGVQSQDPMLPHMIRLAKKYYTSRCSEPAHNSAARAGEPQLEFDPVTTPLYELLRADTLAAQSGSHLSHVAAPQTSHDPSALEGDDGDGFGRPSGTFRLLDFIADEGDPLAELVYSDAEDDEVNTTLRHGARGCESPSSDDDDDCGSGDDADVHTDHVAVAGDLEAHDDADENEAPLFEDDEGLGDVTSEEVPLLLSASDSFSTPYSTPYLTGGVHSYRLTSDTYNGGLRASGASPEVRRPSVPNALGVTEAIPLAGSTYQMSLALVLLGVEKTNHWMLGSGLDEEGGDNANASVYFRVESATEEAVALQWFVQVVDTPWRLQASQWQRKQRLTERELFLSDRRCTMATHWVQEYGHRVDIVLVNGVEGGGVRVPQFGQMYCRYHLFHDNTMHPLHNIEEVLSCPAPIAGLEAETVDTVTGHEGSQTQQLRRRGSSRRSRSPTSMLSRSLSATHTELFHATQLAREVSGRAPHILSIEELAGCLHHTQSAVCASSPSASLSTTPQHSSDVFRDVVQPVQSSLPLKRPRDDEPRGRSTIESVVTTVSSVQLVTTSAPVQHTHSTVSPAAALQHQPAIIFREALPGAWELRGEALQGSGQVRAHFDIVPSHPFLLVNGDEDGRNTARSLSRPTAPMLTTVTANPNSRDGRAGGMRRTRAAKLKRARTAGNVGTAGTSTHATGTSASGAPKIAMMSLCCVDVIADAPLDRFSDSAVNPILAVATATTCTIDDRIEVRYWAVSPHSVDTLSASHQTLCTTEAELLQRVVAFLQTSDPDMIVSWDTIRRGIGYISDRCRIVLRMDAFAALSRLARQRASAAQQGGQNTLVAGLLRKSLGIKVEDTADIGSSEDEGDEEARKGNFAPKSSAIAPPALGGAGGGQRQQSARVAGRIVFNVSKVIRSELKQTSYTMQAVHQSLFGVPLPQYTDGYIADVFKQSSQGTSITNTVRQSLSRFAFHVLRDLVVAPLAIIRHLDLVVRTCELAQLYGILFLEVLSRGSQYRVESFMLRFAKPRGYVAVTPSREQVALQNRQEGIALVMEPYSGFYTDPVVVLDFRSLYPSMMMAYNLCFSTCLGKISKNATIKVGTMSDYTTPHKDILSWLGSGGEGDDDNATDVVFSPNSCMFVKDEHIRRGILPEMLEQIIATRMQVQAVMKLAAADGDDVTRRVLDAQQLGLKLLANVTYGYTAATFSGRMPCSDIADSIVLLGRQTLERAIRQIEGHDAWRAKVVYGDTDSLFIHLPGRSKADAFRIAKEMASAVTASNPDPVVLKFEKVYQPCLMVTKKRYVGYSWEAPDQQVPAFDAKGIETIRRDQCAATARVLESLIRCLFDHSGDLGKLRSYFTEQVTKILRHDVNPTDVIIRREVKLGTYAKDSTLPPAARVALKKIQRDSASAPLYGERVPYVVLTGGAHNAGSDKLMDLVEDPLCVLRRDVPFAIHGDHYMKKHILPALARVFHLVGVNFDVWYQQMPRQLASKSYLFSVDLCKWPVPGLLEARAEEWGASRSAVFDAARDVAAFAQRHRRAAGVVAQSCMTSFAQSTRCAVCGVGKSHTTSDLPPVCAACLDATNGALQDTLSRVLWRRKAVEQELQRVGGRCVQCSHSRTIGVPDLEDIAAQVVHRRDMLDVPLPVDCGSAAAPLLGACVSLDCSQSFLLVRVRDMLWQLHTLEDFLLKGAPSASTSGLAPTAGKAVLGLSNRAAAPAAVAALFGRFGVGGAPPRVGAKDRPVEID